MLSNNNTPTPLSLPSKHGPWVQYYISSRLESGEKHQMWPLLTSGIKESDKGREKKKMKFGDIVLENGGMIEGWGICAICLLEWTFNAALSQAISILNSPFHLILYSSPSSGYC